MVSYEREIAPLLAQHCLDCHGPETQESRFRLDRRANVLQGGELGEPAAIPGKSGESLLIRAVAGLDPHLKMPPDGERLTAEEIGLLRAWIDQGLPGLAATAVERPTTDHWSFQPIAAPVPPQMDGAPLQPIDAFIAAKLRERGLTMSDAADRRTLMRRLYLDALGLLPSYEELEAFAADPRPDAYERLVDRVLASPRTGERWARHWLDAVRFAETNGFETNTPRPNAYHYRDYVIRALNADKPYDRFVFEQLAGDVAGEDAATGFLVAGAYDTVKSPDVQLTLMQRQDELADMINVTGGAFLGLTIGCARCHNHKFDPIPQRDFYSLQAVFAGVKHGERPLRTPEAARREAQLAARKLKLDRVQQQLAEVSAQGEESAGETGDCGGQFASLLDDEQLSGPRRVELLVPPAGHGQNPAGTQRGERDDAGDLTRLPNASSGRYTWWQAQPDQVVAAYRPNLDGVYRLWVSWGCGWQTHAPQAEYLFDADGDPATTDDQEVLLTVDQRLFADGSATPDGRPLWSGFRLVGTRELRPESAVLLKNGPTAAALTADVIAWEPAAATREPPPEFPRLQAPVAARGNTESFRPVPAKYVRFRVLETNQSEPCLDELEVFARDPATGESHNVALAANGTSATSSGDYPNNPKHRLEHIHDGRFGNSYSWISNQNGTGWVQLELAATALVHRMAWARDREGQFSDRLPTQYVIEVAEQPDDWHVVASSESRLPFGAPPGEPLASRFRGLDEAGRERVQALLAEQTRLEQAIASLGQKSLVSYSGVYEQPAATHRLYRGDPLQKREPVPPDALTVISSLNMPEDAPEHERRAALARWITSADNPLAARVVVNRLWHHHFGTGLVATPSDLGANGAKPTHPELLDWLATELRRAGWSLKHIHRLILTSATYRQSSEPRPEALQVDAQSRLLWRFPPRRLEAEVIHDNILQASDSLDLRMYGPGYDVFEPNDNYVRNYVPKEVLGPAEWRRMVYMTKVRMEQDAVFGVFDCPDAGQATPARPRSTTAIQALNLFNSRFVQQQAARLAERATSESPPMLESQIERAFQLTLGRSPTESESAASVELARQYGLPAVCRALLNCNEFLFLP